MAAVKRLAIFALLGLGLGDCGDNYNLQCGTVVIANRQLDFESECAGEDCALTTLGSVTTVPSLLPGDHARGLFANSSMTWTLGMPGSGEGTSLAMSYRCEDGGSLRIDMEGTALAPIEVGGTRDWQRRVWTLRGTTNSFASMDEARAGRHQAVVRVTNTGTALCAVDWLRYVASPRVCGNSGACSSLALTFCGGTCVDTLGDSRNCGGCGRVCGSSQTCENGVCRADCGFCPWGTTCDSDGVCRYQDAGPGDVPDVRWGDTGERPDVRVDASVADGGGRSSVVAGRRCADDSTCRTPSADLRCTATVGGRVCSLASGCSVASGMVASAQCGGAYSVCLRYGESFVAGHCARSCVPSAATEEAGACPAGAVCTSNWVTFGDSISAARGCLPFCRDDADCASGGAGDAGAPDGGTLACNQRTGRCVASRPTPLAAADGTACNPMLAEASGVDPCRGACRSTNPRNPAQGLCASLIDLRVTPTCDDARVRTESVPFDNLGRCMSIQCTADAQCPGELRCVFPEEGAGTAAERVRYDLPSTCGYITALQPGGVSGTGMDAGRD